MVQWHVALEKANKGAIANITEARRVGHALNDEIQSNESVTSLASNPLMLTIIALIKHQQVTLPDRRVELYDIALRTLIQSWNLARSLSPIPTGTSPSGMEDTREVWANIAYWMHSTENGEVMHDQIYQRLVDTLADEFEVPKLNASQAAQSYLASASETSGLLEARGPATYAFVHQSFQEYLAALFLAKPASRAIEKIAPHRHDPRWHEVIRLAAGHLGVIAAERDVLAGLLESLVYCDARLEPWLNNSLRIALGCLTDQVKARQKQVDLIVSCAVDRLNGFIAGKSRAKLMESLAEAKFAISPLLEEKALTLLDHPNWEIRQEGLRILARSERLDTRSLERVALAYKEDEDVDIRGGSAWVLWRSGWRGKDVAKAIFIALGGYSLDIPIAPDPELKAAGVDLLSDPDGLPLVDVILGSLHNWPGDSDIAAICLRLLSFDNERIRQLAAELLGGCINLSGVRAELMARINDPEDVVRAAAVHAISRGAHPDFADRVLRSLVKDPSPYVRAEVVDALSRLPESLNASVIIKEMMSDAADTVRLRIAKVLLESGERELAMRILLELTNSADVRDEAVYILATEGVEEMDEQIWELFEKSRRGGIQYIMLLVERGRAGAKTRDRLIDVLSGENDALSRAAMFGLTRCGPDAAARFRLLQLLTTHRDNVRVLAIKVLMHWPSDCVTVAAVEALLTENTEIVEVAVAALMRWASQDMALAKRLLQRLSTSPNEELLKLFEAKQGKSLVLSSDAQSQIADMLSMEELCSTDQLAIRRNLSDVLWSSLGS